VFVENNVVWCCYNVFIILSVITTAVGAGDAGGAAASPAKILILN